VFDSGMTQVFYGTISMSSELSLPPGDYYIMATPFIQSHYSAQLYPDILCPNGLGFDCVISKGQTININDNQNINAEFFMHEKPKVTIDTVDNYSDQPVNSIIEIYKHPENLYLRTNLLTKHTIHLDPGQYYIWARPSQSYNYISAIYP